MAHAVENGLLCIHVYAQNLFTRTGCTPIKNKQHEDLSESHTPMGTTKKARYTCAHAWHYSE